MSSKYPARKIPDGKGSSPEIPVAIAYSMSMPMVCVLSAVLGGCTGGYESLRLNYFPICLYLGGLHIRKVHSRSFLNESVLRSHCSQDRRVTHINIV